MLMIYKKTAPGVNLDTIKGTYASTYSDKIAQASQWLKYVVRNADYYAA